MKASHWIIAAAALTCAEPVQAGVNDPEVIIYRFPGVKDDGSGSFVGTATVFHCTNFSGATENIRFVTRRDDSSLASNEVFTVVHLRTTTVATHSNLPYQSFSLATGALFQGTTAIAATSTNIICTAMSIDAANVKPVGVSLRGIRFSPVPGSQE